MIRVICVVIGYAFGLFQTAYIIGRLNGIDIRDYGSGNAGSTSGNVTNNFYQTNNSPKALSRLEIYRQSKNLLRMRG